MGGGSGGAQAAVPPPPPGNGKPWPALYSRSIEVEVELQIMCYECIPMVGVHCTDRRPEVSSTRFVRAQHCGICTVDTAKQGVVWET